MQPYMPLSTALVHENAIPPRFQWNAHGGYCGEVAMISAGLYYGQYLSQYAMRAIASPKKGQGSDAQLLLGVNAGHAAKGACLAFEQIKMDDSRAFLAWVKGHVVQGHPVIIGVLNNVNLLQESPPGDDEYDHIVPVIGFGSHHLLTDGKFHSKDEILFSDNGLYTPGNSTPYYQHFVMEPGASAPAYPFLGDRAQANKADGNIYTLLELPKNQNKGGKLRNYGIALLGVEDPDGETLPVRVATDLNYEAPAMAHDNQDRPKPMPLRLTVTVSSLQPGVSYNLYYFDDETQVPTKDFNRTAAAAGVHPWQTICLSAGTIWEGEMPIRSDQKAFFRAVIA